MFFENDLISFVLLDVIELKQENVNIYNTGRNYNALTFRSKADTVIKTATESFRLKDNCVSFLPARLDYKRISKIDELLVIHFEISNCNAKTIEFFMPKHPEEIKNLFIRILECWNGKEVGYKYKCSALFYQILALCHLETHRPNPQDSKIQKSVDHLLRHYREPDISIREIAQKSFISEVYFRKLFKNEYGVSPQKYIIHLRIQHAQKLISSGYHPLKEIALLSGYTDYKYFSTEFKKQVGVSPSEYFYNFHKR